MTLNFAADTLVDLTGTDPFSGDQMWFVPPVDGVNAQLTGRFDLTTASQASLELRRLVRTRSRLRLRLCIRLHRRWNHLGTALARPWHRR